jgi:hypothetical protein
MIKELALIVNENAVGIPVFEITNLGVVNSEIVHNYDQWEYSSFEMSVADIWKSQ